MFCGFCGGVADRHRMLWMCQLTRSDTLTEHAIAVFWFEKRHNHIDTSFTGGEGGIKVQNFVDAPASWSRKARKAENAAYFQREEEGRQHHPREEEGTPPSGRREGSSSTRRQQVNTRKKTGIFNNNIERSEVTLAKTSKSELQEKN